MSFVILLVVTTAIVGTGEASPETKVYIDPTPKIASVGETFKINVNILNVAKLGGFEFCLAYDTNILDCLEVAERSPFLESFGETYIFRLTIEDNYNATHGRLWLSITLKAAPEGATGSGILATITFKATALGESVLNLYSLEQKPGPYGYYLVDVPDKIKLGDVNADPIPHEVVDGYFSDIPRPWIYVDPLSIVPPPYLIPGENFTINVNVFNITNLHRSEFKLAYNTTLLDALAITEGSFMASFGNTSFTSNINETLGLVEANVTLVDPIGATTPNWPEAGNGTLATVTFNVTVIGECDLDLYDTKLTDPTATPIEHYTFDGYFSNKAIIHDIAVTEVTTTPTSMVYAGNNVTISVRVKNNGTESETFNVTAYYDNTPIKTEKVTALPTGAIRILTFEWNTEGVAEGNYTIRAEASTVPGETNTANNKFTKQSKLRVLPLEQPTTLSIELVVFIIVLITVAIAGIIFYRKRS